MQFGPIHKESIRIVLWILLLTLGAKLSISLPLSISEVPISLQSLIVLLIGYYNKSFIAGLILALYLFFAIVGLPVLADSTTGLDVLSKGSFGYLIGFVVAAPFISIFKDYFKSDLTHFLILFGMGTVVILIYGWVHLSFLVGSSDALARGILPFLPGAFLKVVLAVLLLKIVERFWP